MAGPLLVASAIGFQGWGRSERLWANFVAQESSAPSPHTKENTSAVLRAAAKMRVIVPAKFLTLANGCSQWQGMTAFLPSRNCMTMQMATKQITPATAPSTRA